MTDGPKVARGECSEEKKRRQWESCGKDRPRGKGHSLVAPDGPALALTPAGLKQPSCPAAVSGARTLPALSAVLGDSSHGGAAVGIKADGQ